MTEEPELIRVRTLDRIQQATSESIVSHVTELVAARKAYDALTGEGYTRNGAAAAWSESMGRTGPEWQLRGPAGQWYWSYWNFRNTKSLVTIKDDGFHWQVIDYDDGHEIAQGVTTSLYEAFQSAMQGREVRRCSGSGQPWGTGTGGAICPSCHRGPGGLGVTVPVKRDGRYQGTVQTHETRKP